LKKLLKISFFSFLFVYTVSCSIWPQVRETVSQEAVQTEFFSVIYETPAESNAESYNAEYNNESQTDLEAEETPVAVKNVNMELFPPNEPGYEQTDSIHFPLALPHTRPIRPSVPAYIMGMGLIPAKDLAAFLLDINPEVESSFAEELAFIYSEEAAIEGVNHDAAFAQMCLETGFLRFGNLVTPEQNNFCGLGATGPGNSGVIFPNPRTGVRAHIQHLKAYATDAPLKQELVDPRYFLVRIGSSPAIKGLSGTWAEDRSYAEKINNILEQLYSFFYES